MNPGRNIRGISPQNEITVLSIPTEQSPPSRIMSTASPSPWRTCSAEVGESCVNRFALGAASGIPAARNRSSAKGCEGTRNPAPGRPAVTISGISAFFGTIKVNGPGQKRRASASASAGQTSASSRAIPASATCTMTGLLNGRPLTSKIRRTARASRALAPRPYTVSVGNATNPPDRSNPAARSISRPISLKIATTWGRPDPARRRKDRPYPG